MAGFFLQVLPPLFSQTGESPQTEETFPSEKNPQAKELVPSEENPKSEEISENSNKASQKSFNWWGSGKVFKLSPVKDGILLSSGLALCATDVILSYGLKVNRQEYDGEEYSKDDVNALDRLFMNEYSKSLDKMADIGMVLSLASPALLFTTEKEEWLTWMLMYGESVAISQGIKELIKMAVVRARPYMYYDSSTYPDKDVDDGDWANSFLSGHTSLAFNSATFLSYTYWKYFPQSQWKIPVTAGSYALATGTAILRLASGNHFFTDVLAGAVMGSAVGFLVPWIHK